MAASGGSTWSGASSHHLSTVSSASADQGLDRKLGELLSYLMLDFLTLLTEGQDLQAWTPTSQPYLLALHQRQNPGILKVGGPRPFAWCKTRGPNALI